jgi:hypothetical protein
MSDSSRESVREKADAAFRQAAIKVVQRAKIHGTPIIVWEDGRVVERTWEDVERALGQKVDPARR